MTAYRQQALACAVALRAGPGRPRDIRAVAPDAGRILLHNVYGWFERTKPGTYRLTGLGQAALQRWADNALCETATESATDPPSTGHSLRASGAIVAPDALFAVVTGLLL